MKFLWLPVLHGTTAHCDECVGIVYRQGQSMSTLQECMLDFYICIRLELLLWKWWQTSSSYVSPKSFSLILGLFFVKILHFYWLLVPSLKMASIKYYWLLCYKGFQNQYRPILFVKPLHLVFIAICFKLFLESSKA